MGQKTKEVLFEMLGVDLRKREYDCYMRQKHNNTENQMKFRCQYLGFSNRQLSTICQPISRLVIEL